MKIVYTHKKKFVMMRNNQLGAWEIRKMTNDGNISQQFSPIVMYGDQTRHDALVHARIMHEGINIPMSGWKRFFVSDEHIKSWMGILLMAWKMYTGKKVMA